MHGPRREYDECVAGDSGGVVCWAVWVRRIRMNPEGASVFVHVQTIKPLGIGLSPKIASIDWLLAALVITGTDGEQRLSSYSQKEGGLTYAQINEFPNLEGGADRFDIAGAIADFSSRTNKT